MSDGHDEDATLKLLAEELLISRSLWVEEESSIDSVMLLGFFSLDLVHMSFNCTVPGPG